MRVSDLRFGRFALAAIAVVVALTSCQALVSLTVEEPAADAGAPEAAADASDAETHFDPCGAPPPPRKPGGPTPEGGAGLPKMVFAAYVWTIDGAKDPDLCAQPGFDLDGLDTGPPGVCTSNVACAQRPGAGPTLDSCDDRGGVDNNGLRAVRYVRQLPNGGEAFASLDAQILITRGVSNVLLELADYNGERDDDDVVVTFYSSAGMHGVPSVPGMGFAELQASPEVWDGGQDASWSIAESSVQIIGTLTVPTYVERGYVRDGILVVPKVRLGFGPPGLLSVGPGALADGILTAEIVVEGNTRMLKRGRIGTSMPSSTLLGALARIRYHSDQLLCDSPDYQALRPLACSALDLPAHGGPPDAGAACGDISVAFSFASVVSRISYLDGGSDEGGSYELGRGYASSDIAPCPDDAGTIWCDDCDWEGPRRCDGGLYRDAGAE